MRKTKNISNQRFGRLIVVSRVENNKQGDTQWFCKCDCGSSKIVRGSSLRYGSTKSCGCLQKEIVTKNSSKHDLSKHSLYKIWQGIKQRCYNINCIHYNNYGGRGITMFNEWKNNVEVFVKWCLENGWRKGLALDRINNDEGYNPSNCRFVTQEQNNGNTRKQKKKGLPAGVFEVNNKFFIKINTYLGPMKDKNKAINVRENILKEIKNLFIEIQK